MTENLSKSKISLINSLSIKKYRQQHNLFIAEGFKIVSEVLASNLNIRYLIKDENELFDYEDSGCEVIIAGSRDLKKISNLKTASSLIAIVEIPENILNVLDLNDKLSLAIDEIQDPGNLGTIIRICDWFGIEDIICSENSVDVFNPKVVQASMGAFMRVRVHYQNLTEFIPKYIAETENLCFGTFLEGENIYKASLPENALIVLGNEGKGISEDIEALIIRKLLIPAFNNNAEHSESLNVASATSIVCSEFRRKII